MDWKQVEVLGMKRKMKFVIVIGIIILVILCVVFGLSLYGKHQMGKIPELSFQDALAYTTKDNEDAVITVGVIQNGQASYTVYGANGEELPAQLHTYEIGSLTKTFTAALVARAVQEERIDMEDTIDEYLSLPEGNHYPTIEEVLTHTSGYTWFYFESPMIANFFKGRNDFYGISKEMVLNKAAKLDLFKEEYDFCYSNYGYAVLGLILETVYQTDYTTLMNQYVQEELQLGNTRISDQSGDLGNYWDWQDEDAYLSAGALTSNIEDMLAYAQIQLEEKDYFALGHESLKEIDASTDSYKMMGIHMDEIGMAWILDKQNNFIWHNGGTGSYNSYLGVDLKTGTAVVVLSNLSPSERIPATVLGVKKLQELTK